MDSGQVGLWVSVAGTTLSLVGLVVALVQLRKTRDAATAATKAATAATEAAEQSQLTTELSMHTHKIGDVKRCIQTGQLGAALMMLSEILHRTTQVKHMRALRDPESLLALDGVARRLTAVRDQLENHLMDGEDRAGGFDGHRAFHSLSKAEDALADRLGSLMYEGDKESAS